jgi:hypothetical protein
MTCKLYEDQLVSLLLSSLRRCLQLRLGAERPWATLARATVRSRGRWPPSRYMAVGRWALRAKALGRRASALSKSA